MEKKERREPKKEANKVVEKPAKKEAKKVVEKPVKASKKAQKVEQKESTSPGLKLAETVETPKKEAPSSFKTPCKAKYAINAIVDVASRTTPGINKPGGRARIKKVDGDEE